MSFRKRKCKVCSKSFYPFNSLQTWCSAGCGYELSKIKQERTAKALTRRERQLFNDNDIKHQKDKLKTVLHKYIRERDKDLPCVSCGRYHAGQYHAGHYRSSGAMPELRYNELNIHKQCAPCNNHKSGNIIEYRLNLINRIGQDKVDWLEGTHKLHKWKIDDIKAAIDWYKYKLAALRHQEPVYKARNETISVK